MAGANDPLVAKAIVWLSGESDHPGSIRAHTQGIGARPVIKESLEIIAVGVRLRARDGVLRPRCRGSVSSVDWVLPSLTARRSLPQSRRALEGGRGDFCHR